MARGLNDVRSGLQIKANLNLLHPQRGPYRREPSVSSWQRSSLKGAATRQQGQFANRPPELLNRACSVPINGNQDGPGSGSQLAPSASALGRASCAFTVDLKWPLVNGRCHGYELMHDSLIERPAADNKPRKLRQWTAKASVGPRDSQGHMNELLT